MLKHIVYHVLYCFYVVHTPTFLFTNLHIILFCIVRYSISPTPTLPDIKGREHVLNTQYQYLVPCRFACSSGRDNFHHIPSHIKVWSESNLLPFAQYIGSNFV